MITFLRRLACLVVGHRVIRIIDNVEYHQYAFEITASHLECRRCGKDLP